MDILSLDTLTKEIGGQLPPISVMGGGMIRPEGFVIMNVHVPCVRGYNEDQIAICIGRTGDEGLPGCTRHTYSL